MEKKNLPKVLLSLFDTSSEGLWFMDDDNVVQFYNSTFYQQFNISLDHSTLHDWIALVHPEDRSSLTSKVGAHQKEQTSTLVKTRYRVKNRFGRYLWVEAAAIRVKNGNGFAIVGSHKNVSDEVLLNQYLTHMANHDGETGLLNCHQFLRIAPSLMKDGWIVVCRLVHLQQCQRKIGNNASGRLSSALASTLDEVIVSKYGLYRICAEVFVVTIEQCLDVDRAMALVDEIEAVFNDKGLTDTLSLTSRLGLGVLPVCNMSQENPLEQIFNLSEYTRLVNSPVIYSGDSQQVVDRYFDIQDALEVAIDKSQMSIALQPIIDTSTGDFISFEVLARWEHLKLGLISPAEFIPMAEQQGSIHSLGMVVLAQACQYLVTFDTNFQARPLINVNVSAHQFLTKCFVEDVLEVVERFDVLPERVVLEVTESYLLDENPHIVSTLHELSSLGFKLSIDDFGAGMSSITSLFRLPLYQIKLDRGLISDAMRSNACLNLIAHLCEFGRTHQIAIVAEGVENYEIFEKLKEVGVPYLQGYFLYRPSAPEFWLEKNIVV